MSVINNKILNSIVAIGMPKNSTDPSPHWIGTGFLIGRDENIFLVTNKHVVQQREKILIKFNTTDETSQNFPLELRDVEGNNLFSFHPNKSVDIVALSLNKEFLERNRSSYSYFDISTETCSLKEMQDTGLIEGTLVYSLGFPMNLVEAGKQYPICRMGCISRISNAFDLENAIEFLVDAQTFPGNSGGPIIYRPECVTDSAQNPKVIGIVRAYITYRENLLSQQTGQIRSTMEENSGLTVVHPVERLIEVIEIEEKRIKLAKALPRKRKRNNGIKVK